MSECACYWIDLKSLSGGGKGSAPAQERMLNPNCPEHGSVSTPTQPLVVWPDIPRNRNARAS